MKHLLLPLIIILSSSASAAQEAAELDDPKPKVPELVVKKLADNVYLHKSYSFMIDFGVVGGNGLVVVEDGEAFIVDTPWTDADTEKLVNWVTDKGYKLLGSVSTHSHDDRAAGLGWLNRQSIPTYATALTNSILEKEGKAQAQYALDNNEGTLADGVLEVFYPGGGHTVDNVVVWLPQSKILFGGCFVRSLKSKSLGYTGEAQLEQWQGSAEKLLNKYNKAITVVPGHGAYGGIELLRHTVKLAAARQKVKAK